MRGMCDDRDKIKKRRMLVHKYKRRYISNRTKEIQIFTLVSSLG